MKPSEDSLSFLDSFRFKVVFPAYFDPGKFLHFFLTEPRLFKADIIRIPQELIPFFCSYASIYPSLPSYFGMSATVDRLSEKNLSFYETLTNSWHYSFVACAIINLAVIESCSHFIQNYSYFKQNCPEQSFMGHPFSPLLGWCYYETTLYWFEDYSPLIGKKNAFVDNSTLFSQQVKKIQEFFLPYHSLFNEEENPYFLISDHQSTLELIESLTKIEEEGSFLPVSLSLRMK